MTGRTGAALVLVVVSAMSASVRSEEVLPGHTLVLDHGVDPAAASAMPGGRRHDGRLPYLLPTTEPPTRALVPLTGAAARGPTVDAQGRIYVGSAEGLHVVAPDGSAPFTVHGDPIDAAPVLVPGGDVIGIARDGRLTRFAPDGSIRARASLGLGVRFSPLVEDDGSLALVAGSRVLAHVGSDLAVSAMRELPDGVALAPTRTRAGRWAVAAGTELVLVDPRALEIVRTIALPGRAATPVALGGDGSLWVATVEGELVRVRGELRITDTFPLGARLPEAIGSDRAIVALAADGDVLVAVPARGLVRLTPDGSERWVWASDTPVFGAFSVDDHGNAAVLDHVGHVRVIDATGRALWTLLLEGTPLGPPIATAQGRLVVLTDRGVIVLGPG